MPASLVTALEQRLGAAFTIVFGQTECSPVALMTWTTDSITDKAETIGPPLPNVEIKIVDPDTGQTVPIGENGEICTRGYHIMLGYFENEAQPRGHRCRRLAAYRRSRHDGWPRLLHGRGPAKGHDHPRRRKHLSA